jgi:hypothetical protein
LFIQHDTDTIEFNEQMKWTGKGLVAVIIAGTVGGCVILAIAGLAWHGKTISDAGGRVLIATISGLLVALGYYMGSRNGHK